MLPDHRLVAGSADGVIKVIDFARDEYGRALQATNGRCLALVVLSDGRVASASGDRAIQLWDTESGNCVMTLRGHSEMVETLMEIPDGRLASASWDQTVRVWDTTTGACMLTFPHYASHGFNTLAVLPNDTLAMPCRFNQVFIWS